MPDWLTDAIVEGAITGAAFGIIAAPLHFILRYFSKINARRKSGGNRELEELWLKLDTAKGRKQNQTTYIICGMLFLAGGLIGVAANISSDKFLIALVSAGILSSLIAPQLIKNRKAAQKEISFLTDEIKRVEQRIAADMQIVRETAAPPTSKPEGNASTLDTFKPENFAPAERTKVSKKEKSDTAEIGTKPAAGLSASHNEKQEIEILAQYDEDAREVLATISGFPQSTKDTLMLNILRSPDEEAQEIRKRVLLEALGRPDLEWSPEIETIVERCNEAPESEVEELIRVFPTLSKRMKPMEVLDRVVSISGGYPKRYFVYGVRGNSGPKFSVLQHSKSWFTLTSHTGEKDFTNKDEIFSYLQTPSEYRSLIPQ